MTTSTDPATDTAIRRMIKETDGDSFETMGSLEQNLTFKAAEEQFTKRNVPYDSTKMQTLKVVKLLPVNAAFTHTLVQIFFQVIIIKYAA